MRQHKRAEMLLMLTLGWAGAAWAADAGQGEVAFQQSCSNCHTAVQVRQTANARPQPTGAALAAPHMGPDLAVVSRSRGAVYLRKWVKNPWAVRPATACDPRMLRRAQVEDVIAFLASRSRPEPERHRRAPMFRRKEQ